MPMSCQECILSPWLSRMSGLNPKPGTRAFFVVGAFLPWVFLPGRPR